MPEGSQILQTTKDDIARLESLIVGNSVRSLRVAKSRVERRIIMFERRLIQLYSNENIIKARIYNNADMVFIQKNYPSGKNTKVSPVQSFDIQNIAKDPHHAVSYDKYNLTAAERGIKELDAELNRINSEIMTVQAQLNAYKKEKEDIEKRLKDASEKKTKIENLKDKTIGRVLSPTPEDLKQDEISRAEIAGVLLLYRLSIYYYEMSYVPETKERKYSDETKLPQNLLMIRQIFWAHAQSFPEFINEDSENKLNFNDPGDLNNQTILRQNLNSQRYTAENSKTSLEVDRYMRDLRNITNDTSISIGIERKPDPTLPASESLREQTISYPAAAIRLGDFYIGSFELPTFTDSIKKWWKSRNEEMYYNLPICPNKTTQYNTSTDIKKDSADEIQELLIQEGQLQYEVKLLEAREALDSQEQIKIGDLPDDAPDWVKTFVKLYGDGSRGFISFKEQQLVVTRGEGETEADAERNSKKLFPTETLQVKSYVYFSIEGYYVTFKDKSKKFIPISQWNFFQENAQANLITEEEVKGVYVYYFMWATEEQAAAFTG